MIHFNWFLLLSLLLMIVGLSLGLFHHNKLTCLLVLFLAYGVMIKALIPEYSHG